LALHMWVLSWGWSQAWCSILGYLAPMLCRHWCSCFPSWVEIRRWRLVARYTLQIVGSVARTWALLCKIPTYTGWQVEKPVN
jgi:hypothetical protein